MKTTIDIPDSLFEHVKRVALKRGGTFKEVVETALRRLLKEEKSGTKPFKLRKHPFKGHGLVEGLAEADWGEIRRRAYEGRGG